MKLEKADLDMFFAFWLTNDPELCGELRNIQINLLVDRFIREMSYRELAAKYDTTPQKMKKVIEATLQKIDRTVSSGTGKYLRLLNTKMDLQPEKPFSAFEISLN